MTMTFFVDNEKYLAGMTLKNNESLEANNMALHTSDNPQHVVKNRQKLARTIGIDLGNFVYAEQTHSANFYNVTAADKGRGAYSMDDAILNTDALYTFEKNIVLCCFTADCVPVIFHHEKRNVIGVIHSGWHGTTKEIVPKVFDHLKRVEKCEPHHFYVQIGSALCQDKFEVDKDVYEKFHALGYANEYITYQKATNKYHIDNQKTVKKQLELANIPSENIAIDSACTYLHEKGFSYRKDKRAGRHLSFIVQK